ncbi:DNA polymerase III subunit gamma/tau [Candidatus Electrothrix sp.]|uniref:DNA polymerase III subunit gamma/tau n=1 Tax=Candidatus Electrothrix sp. TaxID=2170559 RepID=UPI004057409C
MSYLVLARKSRPQTFAQVVGQKPVVRTLQNGLLQNRVAHALIFSGVRGTGKTTLARIMAKALNCEKGEPPEPCNECRSCKEIMAGSSVDLHEVDGASNRGIQEIRELKENIRFMPTSSKFKIIIIDEVHMLTTEAFNALLKTLEEPPEHVYFMFATTELHKVPVTILSRCQRYELKRVAHAELAAHFASLAEQEGISIDESALNMVVREAGGSVRDGLSLLDQVFSYCGENVTGEEVADVLGLVSHEVIADLARALLGKDIATALDCLKKVYSYGMDIKRFINELLAWFRSLVVCSVSKNPAALLDVPADELALLQEVAGAHSSQTLFMMFNQLLEGLEKAAYSARPRFAVEMTFIRAVQVDDVVPVTDLLTRLDDVLAGVVLPQQQVLPVQQAPQAHQQTAQAEQGRVPAISAPPAESQPVPEPEKKKEPESVVAPPQAASPVEQAQPTQEAPREAPVSESERNPPPPQDVGTAASATVQKRDVRKHWPEFSRYVQERIKWMGASLQSASSAVLENGVLTVNYDDSADCKLLGSRENLVQLTEFAMDFFQEELKVAFKVPNSSSCDTDPDSAAAVRQERQKLANDSLVLAAVDVFNGQVGDIRVGPRFRGPLQKKKAEE